MVQLKKYNSGVVWYGGNFSLWNNQTNLYSSQQMYEQIYYFDKNGQFGSNHSNYIPTKTISGEAF